MTRFDVYLSGAATGAFVGALAAPLVRWFAPPPELWGAASTVFFSAAVGALTGAASMLVLLNLVLWAETWRMRGDAVYAELRFRALDFAPLAFGALVVLACCVVARAAWMPAGPLWFIGFGAVAVLVFSALVLLCLMAGGVTLSWAHDRRFARRPCRSP